MRVSCCRPWKSIASESMCEVDRDSHIARDDDVEHSRRSGIVARTGQILRYSRHGRFILRCVRRSWPEAVRILQNVEYMLDEALLLVAAMLMSTLMSLATRGNGSLVGHRLFCLSPAVACPPPPLFCLQPAAHHPPAGPHPHGQRTTRRPTRLLPHKKARPPSARPVPPARLPVRSRARPPHPTMCRPIPRSATRLSPTACIPPATRRSPPTSSRLPHDPGRPADRRHARPLHQAPGTHPPARRSLASADVSRPTVASRSQRVWHHARASSALAVLARDRSRPAGCCGTRCRWRKAKAGVSGRYCGSRATQGVLCTCPGAHATHSHVASLEGMHA